MNTKTDAIVRAARGIFVGAAVGDALGWPQEVRGGLVGGQKERDRANPRPEFRSWTRSAGNYARRYSDSVRAGEYSDDTQLLLATARACLTGEKWWEWLTEAELPTWPFYQRGGGGAVLAAAAGWADGRPPWQDTGSARSGPTVKRYRNAGGNGVAMRIAPHALRADNADDLVRRIVRDGITTHGHPRALVGALVYAFALRHAAYSQATHRFGVSVDAAVAGLVDVERAVAALPEDWGTSREIEQFAATWLDTNKEVSQLLEFVNDSLNQGAMSNHEATLEKLGCTDPKVNGAGTVSAAAAIYLASRFAARPQDGLLSAAFLRKADTDTLASLTAATLGALHGTQWLGSLAKDLQDASYIIRIAELTAGRVTYQPSWPSRRPRSLRRAMRESLLRHRMAAGEFPDGRHYRIHEVGIIDDSQVVRARLLLDDGQTAIVDLREEPRGASRRDESAQFERSHAPSTPPAEGNGAMPATDKGTAPAKREISPTTAHSPVAGARVILATHSIVRSAAFYAQVTGRDIPVRAGAAEVAPGLLLRQAAADMLINMRPGSPDVIVQIIVDDIPAAIRRIRRDPTSESDPAATVEVHDPDGRTVRISKRTRPGD